MDTNKEPQKRSEGSADIIKKGEEILEKYKRGKNNLEEKVKNNEKWYKMQHWETLRSGTNGPKTVSGWLFNALSNKHADAMDNFPEAVFLPREESDTKDAEILTEIVPVILEQCDFEKTYSLAWWDKIKNGTGIYKIYWDGKKENGLGDIGIAPVDLLSIFWEPGVDDIQKSANVFHVELADVETMQELYPEHNFSGNADLVKQYNHLDEVDNTDKCVLVDWYYKKNVNGKEVVHYIKYARGDTEPLYASEQDPEAAGGFYEHGLFPYVFDVLFPEKDAPYGIGYIDVMKDTQVSIDSMWTCFEENAKKNALRRKFYPDGAGINADDLEDPNKEYIQYAGAWDGFHEENAVPLAGSAVNIYGMKIDELKETANNRDFSQGSTSNGVTAASAIAALQEAGNKTSRDMVKSSYRSFREILVQVVELIRQFYNVTRIFRITNPNKGTEFIGYNNDNLNPQGTELLGGVEYAMRRPVFDIKIKAQKANPFAKAAMNDLAIQLYNAGMFNPDLAEQALICLDMMDFEGKEDVMQKVQENASMAQQMQEMKMQIQQMAGVMDGLTGGNMLGAVSGQETPQAETGKIEQRPMEKLDRIRQQTEEGTEVR